MVGDDALGIAQCKGGFMMIDLSGGRQFMSAAAFDKKEWTLLNSTIYDQFHLWRLLKISLVLERWCLDGYKFLMVSKTLAIRFI